MHIMTCMWLSQIPNRDISWGTYYGEGISGFDDPEYVDEICRKLYMTAYYFIYSTLFTVGYGDLSPRTNDEAILNCFIILIGLPFMVWIFTTLKNMSHAYSRNN